MNVLLLFNNLISSFKQNILAMVDPSKSAERLVYFEDENIYINIIDRDVNVIYEYEVFKFFISHQNTHMEIIEAFDNKMASKFDVFYDLSNFLKENFLIKVESF